MTWRRIAPVLSPVSTRALVSGAGAVLGLHRASRDSARAVLMRQYDAMDALLTDTGTSALGLLLRKLLPAGSTIALPAYACIDLTTVAVGAGVQVRLYDIDPATLSPDIDSVRDVIRRGVDAIVVAHLYGYPADVRSVQNLAAEHGIPVIEDAAQGSGGTVNGALLGSLAETSILSFGRGKGTTAGSGGAVLVRSPALAEWTRELRSSLQPDSRGAAAVLSLAGQKLLARPWLYNIPASIPALKLSEMVYHVPRAPRAMTVGSIAVLMHTLMISVHETAGRRARAREILAAVRSARDATPVRSIAGGESGYLRLAFLDNSGSRQARPALGALRGYPVTLDQHAELRPLLHPREQAGAGSRYLRDRLFTIPTHARVDQSYAAEIAGWLTEKSLDPRLIPAVS